MGSIHLHQKNLQCAGYLLLLYVTLHEHYSLLVGINGLLLILVSVLSVPVKVAELLQNVSVIGLLAYDVL